MGPGEHSPRRSKDFALMNYKSVSALPILGTFKVGELMKAFESSLESGS
jgi:hypothetical protein